MLDTEGLQAGVCCGDASSSQSPGPSRGSVVPMGGDRQGVCHVAVVEPLHAVLPGTAPGASNVQFHEELQHTPVMSRGTGGTSDEGGLVLHMYVSLLLGQPCPPCRTHARGPHCQRRQHRQSAVRQGGCLLVLPARPTTTSLALWRHLPRQVRGQSGHPAPPPCPARTRCMLRGCPWVPQVGTDAGRQCLPVEGLGVDHSACRKLMPTTRSACESLGPSGGGATKHK